MGQLHSSQQHPSHAAPYPQAPFQKSPVAVLGDGDGQNQAPPLGDMHHSGPPVPPAPTSTPVNSVEGGIRITTVIEVANEGPNEGPKQSILGNCSGNLVK
ncbi:hypothetical protein K469DRAFT_717657 [Zopfia rhizophila CBS 207.26]|uniref:Uncharacterized protein n=1 Tax=Zopfia rhizophila CBS 207.26 TaxID=1314779 RepID=A0A6A6DLN6_9PEZI|nr:hypothetical protein K469DRAFT_717657 [Zopfia rhizophila CBS 207.26]